MNGPRPKVSREQVAAAAREYAEGRKTLAELAALLGVTGERLRQLFVRDEPWAREERERRERERRKAEAARVKAAAEAARREAPAEAWREGRLCAVCRGPRTTGGPRRSRSCSPECAGLWAEFSYYLDPEARRQHEEATARWTVKNADKVTRWRVRDAERILSGAPRRQRVPPGSWVHSERVKAALARVEELRAQVREQWGERP